MYLLNSDFETAKSWIAHTGGRVTHMVERNGILITLGVGTLSLHVLVVNAEFASIGRSVNTPAPPQSMGSTDHRQEERGSCSIEISEGAKRYPSSSRESLAFGTSALIHMSPGIRHSGLFVSRLSCCGPCGWNCSVVQTPGSVNILQLNFT